MQEIPVNRRRWVSKYVSGHFATGKNMCQWHFRTSSQCPRCGDMLEDKQHILTCHAPEARELWETSLKAVERWLKDEGTDTMLREHLMDYLRSWSRTSPNPQAAPTYIAEQDAIGQHYIWDGWLSKAWREHQEQIWKQSRSRKSSKRWTTELIKKLWNVAWDMWEQRNGALHNSASNRDEILEKDINDRIKQIYDVGPGQLARKDLGLMRQPVTHQLQLPLPIKQQWLDSIAAALHRQQLHEHGAMLGEQRVMEVWVIRNPTRNPPAPVHLRRTLGRPNR